MFAISFDGFIQPERYDTREEAEQALSGMKVRMGARFNLLFEYSYGVVEIQG